MDSGKFESASRVRVSSVIANVMCFNPTLSKPYAFHQVMRSLFIPLRLATDARGLELVTELDSSIDQV